MSDPIIIGIPVLGRPQRVIPIVESIAASVRFIQLRPLFICSPGDTDELSAILDLGSDVIVVPWQPGPGDFAKKHNEGLRQSTGEWYFMGADDLVFHAGWAEHAIAAHLKTEACVVGTNDLGNQRTVQGAHSTHSLVNRDYLACGTIDEAGKVLHEGYDHQFVDDEFVQTARARGTYIHAFDSIVEHMHPDWGKGSTDTTYDKAKRGFHEDRALFNSRKHLWGQR